MRHSTSGSKASSSKASKLVVKLPSERCAGGLVRPSTSGSKASSSKASKLVVKLPSERCAGGLVRPSTSGRLSSVSAYVSPCLNGGKLQTCCSSSKASRKATGLAPVAVVVKLGLHLLQQ